MPAWLKTFRVGNPLSPINDPADLPAVGTTTSFLEPLSVNDDGSPKLTKRGQPLGRPSWKVGHLIGAYWSGSYVVSAVWVVLGDPQESELDGWAWETEVGLVAANHSVPIEQLGIRAQLLGRRVRLRLGDDQEEILRAEFEV